MAFLINKGNIDDIRTSYQYAESTITIAELEKEIASEKKGSNRSTVIKFLQGKINRKKREQNKAETLNRSAKSGKFVSKKFADKHKATTVTEKIK